MKLSNKAYDILKLVIVNILPALATCYFTVAQIWCIPYGEEVVGTISAITLCLGTILKLSSNNYEGENDTSDLE